MITMLLSIVFQNLNALAESNYMPKNVEMLSNPPSLHSS